MPDDNMVPGGGELTSGFNIIQSLKNNKHLKQLSQTPMWQQHMKDIGFDGVSANDYHAHMAMFNNIMEQARQKAGETRTAGEFEKLGGFTPQGAAVHEQQLRTPSDIEEAKARASLNTEQGKTLGFKRGQEEAYSQTPMGLPDLARMPREAEKLREVETGTQRLQGVGAMTQGLAFLPPDLQQNARSFLGGLVKGVPGIDESAFAPGPDKNAATLKAIEDAVRGGQKPNASRVPPQEQSNPFVPEPLRGVQGIGDVPPEQAAQYAEKHINEITQRLQKYGHGLTPQGQIIPPTTQTIVPPATTGSPGMMGWNPQMLPQTTPTTANQRQNVQMQAQPLLQELQKSIQGLQSFGQQPSQRGPQPDQLLELLMNSGLPINEIMQQLLRGQK
jgi:hypothetical protein